MEADEMPVYTSFRAADTSTEPTLGVPAATSFESEPYVTQSEPYASESETHVTKTSYVSDTYVEKIPSHKYDRWSRFIQPYMERLHPLWQPTKIFFSSFLQWDLALHAVLMLTLVWIAGVFGVSGLLAISWSAFYLFLVARSQKVFILEEAEHKAAQREQHKKLLTDVESLAWMNGLMAKMWNVNIAPLASQMIMTVGPWFLEMFKPPPLSVIVIEKVNLGRTPPLLSNAKLYSKPENGDDAVLEMDMQFMGDEHCAVKVNVRMVGLGVWATAFISKVSMKGKVRVGLKFLPDMPLIERARVTFVGAPVLKMAIRPLAAKTVDVTHIPVLATYIEHTVAKAIECSLVEPNVLVIDVPKMLNMEPIPQSLRPEWMQLQNGLPAAKVHIQVLAAENLKVADRSGTSDPYVRLQLGRQKMKTSIKYKNLNPVWNEAFCLQIPSWRRQNTLKINVKDKDQWNRDDAIGFRAIDLAVIKDGQKRDLWLQLQGVPHGKLHIIIWVENTPPQMSHGLSDEAIGVEEARRAGQAMEEEMVEAQRPSLQVNVESSLGQPGAMKIVGPGIYDSRASGKPVVSDSTRLVPEGAPDYNYSSASASANNSTAESAWSESEADLDDVNEEELEEKRRGKVGGVRRKVKKGLSKLIPHRKHNDDDMASVGDLGRDDDMARPKNLGDDGAKSFNFEVPLDHPQSTHLE